MLMLPGGERKRARLAEIKSALELALERAERYGKASKEEMAAAQYQVQGRHLAVKVPKRRRRSARGPQEPGSRGPGSGPGPRLKKSSCERRRAPE